MALLISNIHPVLDQEVILERGASVCLSSSYMLEFRNINLYSDGGDD